MIDEKTRAGFYGTAGKGKEIVKPDTKQVKLDGDNAIQKALNYSRERMPEGHNHNNYRSTEAQTNSYNNRVDPSTLEDQRKVREGRKIQLKYAKDRIGVKTRHETSQQDKLKEGFSLGAQKIDRISGMSVVNPTMRNSVPMKELIKKA